MTFSFPLAVSVAAVGGLAALLGGCSTLPAPVVSPFAPEGTTSLAVTNAVTWGFARARILRPDGTAQSLTGNGEEIFGEGDPSIAKLDLVMPAIASGYEKTGEWDGGAHLGWRVAGGSSRRRLLTLSPDTVTSLVAAANFEWWSFRAGNASLAVEQTIGVGGGVTALFRLGLGGGRRRYDVEMPQDLDPTSGHDNRIGGAHLDLYRNEARLETVVGLVLFDGLLIASVQPYFLVARAAPSSVTCSECTPGVRLVDFTLDHGLTVAFTLHLWSRLGGAGGS